MAVELLLLLQHQHEMVPEAALHHHPVDSAGQIDVRRQEHNIFALQRGYALVRHHQVGHDQLECTLPFARGARTGTQVRPELAGLFVVCLFCVNERGGASVAAVLARELDVRGDLLHGQVPDVAQ